MVALRHFLISLAVGSVTARTSSRPRVPASCDGRSAHSCRQGYFDGEVSLLSTGQLRKAAAADEQQGRLSKARGSPGENGHAHHDDGKRNSYDGEWDSHHDGWKRNSYMSSYDSHQRNSKHDGGKKDSYDGSHYDDGKMSSYDSHHDGGKGDSYIGKWDSHGKRKSYDSHHRDGGKRNSHHDGGKLDSHHDRGNWDSRHGDGKWEATHAIGNGDYGRNSNSWGNTEDHGGRNSGDRMDHGSNTWKSAAGKRDDKRDDKKGSYYDDDKKAGFKKCVHKNEKGTYFTCAMGDTCCGNACAAKGSFCCEGVKGYEYPVANAKDCPKKTFYDDGKKGGVTY